MVIKYLKKFKMKKILLLATVIVVLVINTISNVNYSQGEFNLDFLGKVAMAASGEYPDCGQLYGEDVQHYSYNWSKGMSWIEYDTHDVYENTFGEKIIAGSMSEAIAIFHNQNIWFSGSFTTQSVTCDGNGNVCCRTTSPILDSFY
jgi:hypothetical protein